MHTTFRLSHTFPIHTTNKCSSKQKKIHLTSFRKATSDPDPRQHSWNLTAGKRHCGHLGQAGRCRESTDVDLEGSKLWLPWLHEDHQLRGPGRHLQRLHRHAGLLRGEVGQPDPEDRSQHSPRQHRPAQCERGRLPASVVPLVSRSYHQD